MARRIGALVVALWLGGCGDAGGPEGEEPRPPEAPAEPGAEPGEPGAPALPAPARGGTVVAVGPYYLEVVAHADGPVDATVHEAAPEVPAGARLTVRVTADDGAQHPVLLTWDPGAAEYRGRLYRVAAIPGPIRVTLRIGDTTHEGRASTLVVTSPAPAPPPRPATTPRTPTPEATSPELPPAPEAPAPEAPAPEAPVAEAPAPPPVVAPPPVSVRPDVVAPSPAIGPVLRPATPIVDRRGRASASPRRDRTETSDQATVRPRE